MVTGCIEHICVSRRQTERMKAFRCH